MGVDVEHGDTECAFSEEISCWQNRDEALRHHREKSVWCAWKDPENLYEKKQYLKTWGWALNFFFLWRWFQRRPGLTEMEEQAREVKWAYNLLDGFEKREMWAMARCEVVHTGAQTIPAQEGSLQGVSEAPWQEGQLHSWVRHPTDQIPRSM